MCIYLMMTEANLLEKLKKGDKTAFAQLVALYSSKVLNICYRFLLDKQDAEDISQEVFIEVFESLHSFRGDAQLSTWIYRIAVTKSLDELKRQNRKRRISSLGKLFHLEDVANWLAGGSMPDKHIQENENMKLVMHALNRLPDNQRVAFTLSKIEGYSHEEIAEMLHIQPGTSRSQLVKARKMLQQQIIQLQKIAV